MLSPLLIYSNAKMIRSIFNRYKSIKEMLFAKGAFGNKLLKIVQDDQIKLNKTRT